MTEAWIYYVLDLMGSAKFKKNWMNIAATCPMAAKRHKNGVDHNPSFSVLISDEGDSVGYCFACGMRGTLRSMSAEWEESVEGIQDVVKRIEDGTYAASSHDSGLKTLRELGGMPIGWIDVERNRLRERNRMLFYGAQRPEEFDEDKIMPIDWVPGRRENRITTVPTYALDRGLTYRTIKELEIGYDEANDAVVFPIGDRRKRLVGYALRSCSDPDWKYRYNYGFKKKWFLYGEDRISKERGTSLVLVEGMVDVAMVWQAGVNVMGILGSELSEVQARKVIDATAIAPNVFLMFDGDEAGERATSGAFDKLLRKVPRLRIVKLEKGRDPGGMHTLGILEALKGAM